MGGLSFFKKIRDYSLDFLFPINCLGCGKEGEWVCRDCLHKLKISIPNFLPCPKCGKVGESGLPGKFCYNHKENLDGLWIASSSEVKLLREAIHSFKYKYIEDLEDILGSLFIDFLQVLENNYNIKNYFTYIIPVPLHKKRQAERGYNQADLLSKKPADFLEIKVFNNILKRSRYTFPQVNLSKAERKVNIKNAFRIIKKPSLKDDRILLIDDVYTTGSTMEECAGVLKKSGAKSVWGLVLARGL